MPIDFAKKWPYGVLRTANWIGPLLTVISLHCRAYDVMFLTYLAILSAHVFFVYNLVVWGLHVIGVAQVVGLPSGYDPNDDGDDNSAGKKFARLDRWTSTAGWRCFGIIALISFLARLLNWSSASPSTRLSTTAYFFSMIFSGATTASFAYHDYLLRITTFFITEGFSTNHFALGQFSENLSALWSADNQSQLQALHQLFLMCRSAETRKQIFELSEPGKHPRNWQYTRDICKHYINIVLTRVQLSTHCKSIRLSKINTKALSWNTSSQTLSPPSPGLKEKQSFFIPPSMTNKTTTNFIQGVTDDSNVNDMHHNYFGYVPLPPIVNDFVQCAKLKLFEPPQLISLFELQCAAFAVKSLAAVLANALREDSYGVTQKDNKAMISLLTQLTISIDGFVRSNEPIRMRRESNITELDSIVAQSLVQIGYAFGECIYKINLGPNDVEVIETFCGELRKTNGTDLDQSQRLH